MAAKKGSRSAHHQDPTPVRLTHFHKGMLAYLAERLQTSQSEVIRQALTHLLERETGGETDDFVRYLKEVIEPTIKNADARKMFHAKIAVFGTPSEASDLSIDSRSTLGDVISLDSKGDMKKAS